MFLLVLLVRSAIGMSYNASQDEIYFPVLSIIMARADIVCNTKNLSCLYMQETYLFA